MNSGIFRWPEGLGGYAPSSGVGAGVQDEQSLMGAKGLEDEASSLDEKIAKLSAERDKALRAASTYRQPKQDPKMGVRAGKAGLVLGLALAAEALKKGSGAKGFGGFMRWAQNAEQMRFQNQAADAEAGRNQNLTNAQILQNQIGLVNDQRSRARELADEKVKFDREMAIQKIKEAASEKQNRRIAISQAFGTIKSSADVAAIKSELSIQGVELTPKEERALDAAGTIADKKLEQDHALKMRNVNLKFLSSVGKTHKDLIAMDGEATEEEATRTNAMFRIAEIDNGLPENSLGFVTPGKTIEGQRVEETKRVNDQRIKKMIDDAATSRDRAATYAQAVRNLAGYQSGSLSARLQEIDSKTRGQVVGGLREQLKTLSANVNQLRQRVAQQMNNLLKTTDAKEKARIQEDIDALGETIAKTKQSYNEIGAQLQMFAKGAKNAPSRQYERPIGPMPLPGVLKVGTEKFPANRLAPGAVLPKGKLPPGVRIVG